jgi:hypothetical protein
VPDEIFYVHSKRAGRMRRNQTFQHIAAAVILVMNGMQHLHHNTAFAVAEIAAGALLIGTVAWEKVRHVHSSRVAWVELAGAVMMFVEAIEKVRARRHHTLFYLLIFVQPLVLLMFALFDAQLEKKRYLKADEEGVTVRVRLIYSKRYEWSEFDRIDLSDVVEQDEAKRWLEEQKAKRVSDASAAT